MICHMDTWNKACGSVNHSRWCVALNQDVLLIFPRMWNSARLRSLQLRQRPCFSLREIFPFTKYELLLQFFLCFPVTQCLQQKSETASARASECLSMCLLLPPQNKNGRRLLRWVIVTWLTRCLLRVTAAALLIACLRWMMAYLILTHSTQLLFTLAEARGGSRGSQWPYGEGGRAHAEWLEA